jgi:tRNA G18 (ribose-2'-O)-methylase SpoU
MFAASIIRGEYLRAGAVPYGPVRSRPPERVTAATTQEAPDMGETGVTPVAETREHEVGVGPWVGTWPEDERLDPELLRDGDRRNVVDAYRYWRHDAIVADLDARRHPFHVAVENWQHDFNIGSVVRTANAFLAAEVHIVGRRRWNRRGAMVTDRYQHVRHHEDASALAAWAHAADLPLLGVDNLPGSVPLETFDLPRACVLLFGQEGPGLSEAARDEVDAVLSVAQYGSTRSINAGAAAAIAMHAWIRQHA